MVYSKLGKAKGADCPGHQTRASQSMCLDGGSQPTPTTPRRTKNEKRRCRRLSGGALRGVEVLGSEVADGAAFATLASDALASDALASSSLVSSALASSMRILRLRVLYNGQPPMNLHLLAPWTEPRIS